MYVTKPYESQRFRGMGVTKPYAPKRFEPVPFQRPTGHDETHVLDPGVSGREGAFRPPNKYDAKDL